MAEAITYFCPQCITKQPTFEYWDERHQRLLVRCQACGSPVEEGLVGKDGVAFSRRAILCIDDDPLMLEFLSQLLAAHHFLPLTARDGRTGLATARRERPELILLDVLMPDLDGFSVCRELRADPKLKETPIILVTGMKDPLLRTKAFKAGATLAMEKPLHPDKLIATIRTALELKPKAPTPSPREEYGQPLVAARA